MPDPEIVDIEFDTIVHETDKAYRIDFGDDEVKWVPISIAEIDRDERVITVPTWWADKEELR